MLKKIIITGSVLLAVISVFLFSVFWYRLTSFYKDCVKITEGMTAEQVENILQPYLNNKRFYVSKEAALWGPGIYVSSNASGNSCSVSIKDGKAEKVEARFE